MASAAFFIIQNTPALKSGTWSGLHRLWLIGGIHLVAAVGSALLLRRFGLMATLSAALASLGGAIAAGSVVFGGIGVLPKIEPLFGSSATNPLNPNLNVAANEQIALLSMGSCVLAIPNALEIGDYLQYYTTTGVIST